MRRHHFAEQEGAGQVVVVVPQGDFAGFADRFQSGKMDHRVDLVFGEDPVDPFPVEQVDLIEPEILPGDFADAVEHFRLGIDKIVEDDNLFPRVQQFNAGVGTDITGAASDQNRHKKSSFL